MTWTEFAGDMGYLCWDIFKHMSACFVCADMDTHITQPHTTADREFHRTIVTPPIPSSSSTSVDSEFETISAEDIDFEIMDP